MNRRLDCCPRGFNHLQQGAIFSLSIPFPSLMVKILVPTLNGDVSDHIDLCRLWSQVQQAPAGESLEFDLISCGFLQQHAVAFLGALFRFARHRGCTVSMPTKHIPSHVWTNLCQNGFGYAHGLHARGWEGNSIAYREDSVLDNGFMDYLQQGWLGRGWVDVPSDLADAICGQMWEIYQNAFDHSESSVGVTACGQRYPKLGVLKLSVVDFGVGIPQKVSSHLGKKEMAAPDTMRWAFASGNSTRVNSAAEVPTPGGLGLDLLKSFVRKHRGKLEIYSHSGIAWIDYNGEKFTSLDAELPYKYGGPVFEGTIVTVSLDCSVSSYVLSTHGHASPSF